MSFFDFFPVVTDATSGANLRNISLSVIFNKLSVPAASNYRPYVLKEGETPTQLAFNYYDDVSYVWLIAMANSIVDFNSQWPMTSSELDAYIISKYGDLVSPQATIAYYVSEIDPTYPRVTPFTYQNMSPTKIGLLQLIPVSQYQDEVQNNEAKRNIRLIDKSLAPGLMLELSTLLNQ